jgi:tRNA pseudouridine55 synthase
LPICFGEATKLSSYLLEADKTYYFVCRLGITTDTADAEGNITGVRPIKLYTTEQIKLVLDLFTGEIQQIPPMYSALKQQGKRLYELARQGIIVERKPRPVKIYELHLLSHTENTLECRVRSSKGMYVRTLAEDIGETLGCGAHIITLRRSSVEPYKEPQMVTIEELREQLHANGVDALDNFLLPIDSALSFWPAVSLNKDTTYYFRTGHPVQVFQRPEKGWVRLYDPDDCFIGIGEILPDGRIAPRRLFKNMQ